MPHAKSKGALNVCDHLFIKAYQPSCITGKFLLSTDIKLQGLKYVIVKDINRLLGEFTGRCNKLQWRRACKASRKCIFKVASEDRFKDLRLGSVMIRANLATVAFILETIGYHWKCCGRRIIQSDGS